MNERRLNGRDVLAKTFPARTKKGYDPVDVDAYLELVAAQVDLLHGDVAQASTNATSEDTPSDELTALRAELDQATAARDALEAKLTEELQAGDALRSENDQLRMQLTAVAPPPPVASTALTTETTIEEAQIVSAEVVPAATDELVIDDRAAHESYNLVLRAAQRSAEEAIAEAHVRADEIVADANLTASRIAQESDRKAYEAANRAHKELSEIKAQVDGQNEVLATITTAADQRRTELRLLGQTILQWADQSSPVVDLRAEQTPAQPAASDSDA